jgi:hypothetical protein
VAVVEVEGVEYEVTDAERAEYDQLIEQHFDPVRALQIATGDFEDIDPPPEREP